MKKNFFVILIFLIILILPKNVFAERLSLTTLGINSSSSDLTYYGEHFRSFYHQTSSPNYRIDINKVIPKNKSFTIYGYLMANPKEGTDGISFNNLALTSLSTPCQVYDYSKYYDSTEPIKSANNLYYFECKNISYNVDHSLRFELLGYYPDILGQVYMYDWINFSWDDESSQWIIANQDKNQAKTNEKFDEVKRRQEITNNKLDDMNKQQHEDSQKNTDAINNMNDTISDSNVNDANNSASNFFIDFENNDHGLSAIITAPLNFIKDLSTYVCTPIKFEAPFVKQEIILPCMKPIYQRHFNGIIQIWEIIFLGMISYNILKDILIMVHGFKDPDSDRIEVLDL